MVVFVRLASRCKREPTAKAAVGRSTRKFSDYSVIVPRKIELELMSRRATSSGVS